MPNNSCHVYTDGENLFVAPNLLKARAMFVEAFGGDRPRDHGKQLKKLWPRQTVILLDDDEGEQRFWALTVARVYPGQTIMAR